MSDANIFGQMVSGFDVERAMVDFLSAPRGAHQGTWIDTYLGEVERLQGYQPNAIERPRGIVTSSDFEKWPEDQVPVYVVICPGVTGPPTRRGDGSYGASFGVGIAAVASDVDADGNSTASSRKLAQAHGLAIRTAVTQHKSLGGFANTCKWLDESYRDLIFDDTRTLATAMIGFEVVVESVVQTGGPSEPVAIPPDDPGPWPTVTEIDVDVEPKTLTEALH